MLSTSISTLSAVLLTSLVPETLMERLFDQLAELISFETAAIFVLTGSVLQIAASRGFVPNLNDRDFSITDEDAQFLQQVAQQHAPHVIADRAASPAASTDEAPAQATPHTLAALFQSEMRSRLIVPLMVKREMAGVLCLGHRQANFYDEGSLNQLQAFADAAAIAMVNARHYRQAQDQAAAQERIRLSYILHDTLLPTLFSASLIANALDGLLRQNLAEAAFEIDKLRRLIEGASAQTRTVLLNLRPDRLSEEPLDFLIDSLCQSASAEAGFVVQSAMDGDCSLPAEPKITLYRIAQEALHNVIKHAGATEIKVTLSCQAGGARIEVVDNGCGFNPQAVSTSHMGLRIMRERASAANAAFELTSSLGRGTRVSVTWPSVVNEA